MENRAKIMLGLINEEGNVRWKKAFLEELPDEVQEDLLEQVLVATAHQLAAVLVHRNMPVEDCYDIVLREARSKGSPELWEVFRDIVYPTAKKEAQAARNRGAANPGMN